ncbi:uncharacterized protein LOC125047870 isoform X2 [Penaeus chinensis]|uniref:uncharacterized protein LOC125047870 isoform X2 n=1 Tax=Penaeus chinensis TaxID=139456 RepID=UPI001FB642C7|nr:uncharacterized protein LOC125047870 isoform X2 [Penaeus chinensis]
MSVRMDNSVHEWAVGLTRRHRVFSLDQPLKPEHFTNLTRDKNLQPILSFLMRHVCPPEERRLIKLNLKHSRFRKKLTGEEGEILPTEERFKLKASIVDANSAIAAETAEIQQLNRRKEELRQREVELRRRAMLMKVSQEEREKEIQHCKLWRSQLSLLQEDLPSVYDGQAGVDINLQKQLRGNMLDLEKLRRSIITGHFGTPDRMHMEKLRVWERIGDAMATWGPRSLMVGMTSEVQEVTRSLHAQVQNVDLVKDARELRLKCENDGAFIDEMNPGGVIESVRELLGQMSASHVKLYVEAYQADLAAQSLSRALKTLHNNIFAAAKRSYTDDGITAAVVKVVKENVSVAGERAALNAAEQLTSSLQERANTASRARDALRAKHAQIISFNKEVQDGIESIQCLALCVGEGLQIIRERLQEVRSTTEEALEGMAYPTPVSTNSLANECEAFIAVPLNQLLTTTTEEFSQKRKAEMSTTPLVWYDQAAAQPGWEALRQLCNGILSWDGVFEAVCEKQELTTSLQKEMERLTFAKAAMQATQKSRKILSSQEMKELTEKVERSDSKLEKDITRLTTSCEKQVNIGMHHVVRVNKLLTEWWEQPAKEITL